MNSNCLRSHVIEDVAAHQSKLENLIKNDGNSSKVATDKSVETIQFLPRSHPEEEIKEFGEEHGKHEVRSEGFNLSSLYHNHNHNHRYSRSNIFFLCSFIYPFLLDSS